MFRAVRKVLRNAGVLTVALPEARFTMAVSHNPVGAGNYVTSCDLGIFVNQAAESVPAQNTHTGHSGGWMCAASGRALQQRPMRPVRIVVIGVLAKDQPQMPFTGDQQTIQALAAGTAYPAFGDRIAPHRQLHPIRMIGTGVPR